MRKNIRRTLTFVLAVILIQGLALLFFTPAGLERVFVLPLRLHAEKFKPDNNAYAVYYDSRTDVAAADLIVVGIDPNVAEIDLRYGSVACRTRRSTGDSF